MGGNQGVSAIIVTRGDGAPLAPIIDSIPDEWETWVWDNGAGELLERAKTPSGLMVADRDLPDLGVYGRYEAIEKYSVNPIVYVQDDDCLLGNPRYLLKKYEPGVVTTNIPYAFRSSEPSVFTMLVGFGAIFDRELPSMAFWRFHKRWPSFAIEEPDVFRRTSDIIFWALSKTKIVHTPIDLLPNSYAENRMWRQPDHTSERQRVLAMAEAA